MCLHHSCSHLLCEQCLHLTSNFLLCRMIIPPTDQGRFDSMVLPFELEAYDILKSRSGKKTFSFLHFSSHIVLAVKSLDTYRYSFCIINVFSLLECNCIYVKHLQFLLYINISYIRLVFSVRSPVLRSPRHGGTPRRHLITPIPGNIPAGVN